MQKIILWPLKGIAGLRDQQTQGTWLSSEPEELSILCFQMKDRHAWWCHGCTISCSLLIKNKLSPLFLFTAFPQFSSNVKIERQAGSICLKIPKAFECVIRVNILCLCFFFHLQCHLQRAFQAVQYSSCSINIFIFRRNGPKKMLL